MSSGDDGRPFDELRMMHGVASYDLSILRALQISFADLNEMEASSECDSTYHCRSTVGEYFILIFSCCGCFTSQLIMDWRAIALTTIKLPY